MNRPARRSQTERSEEMRARIAKSAYEVIAERGHSAFRTAAVLAHSGVSQGAILHHFPTKESLTLAAIHYALNIGNEASEARIAGAGNRPIKILRAMAEDFKDFFMGDRFWVSLDITMDADKDTSATPAIREIVSQARQPIYQRWADALVDAGMNKVESSDLVTATAALIAGYAVRTLWTDDKRSLDKALDRLFSTVNP